jgi:hypothetical protein
MAKDLRAANSANRLMDEPTRNLIDECKRQEESCLYTSTALFEWLKCLRWRKGALVVAPIVLGALATWPLLTGQVGLEWLTGSCALLAGLAPALYKALDLDLNLEMLARHAHLFKVLQDRFRQAWRVTALASPGDFKGEFDSLMDRMDEARSLSLTPPERFFRRAQAKIQAGHYAFNVDRQNTVP